MMNEAQGRMVGYLFSGLLGSTESVVLHGVLVMFVKQSTVLVGILALQEV